MKLLLFIFLNILIIEPALSQNLANSGVNRSVNLCSLASRQYLSGKSDESLALYQKAISKAESDYGKNSRVAADLYFQLGVRAFWLSKFNLAEHSLKKAVEINPASEAAQIMLVNLLKFRNRDTEAYGHVQQALKKHPESMPLRKKLVLSFEEKDPAKATEQAYLVTCLQNGIPSKISFTKQTPSAQIKSAEKKETSEKAAAKTKTIKDLATHRLHQNEKPKNEKSKEDIGSASTAIYEPIKSTANKEPKPKKVSASHKRSTNRVSTDLIPPPPPDNFGLVPISHGGMKAKAGIIKLEKPKAEQPSEEHQKPKAEKPPAESDPDFLLEWAGSKKKPQSK